MRSVASLSATDLRVNESVQRRLSSMEPDSDRELRIFNNGVAVSKIPGSLRISFASDGNLEGASGTHMIPVLRTSI